MLNWSFRSRTRGTFLPVRVAFSKLEFKKHLSAFYDHCTKNWIYSHLLMSKYDANAVQMCGKHGKCRIYFTFT